MDQELWCTERRWPDRDAGPLTLRLTFGLVAGRPEVVGVELWGTDPAAVDIPNWPGLLLKPSVPGNGEPAPIRTETMRLPLRRLLDEWRAKAVRRGTIAADVDLLSDADARLPRSYREMAIRHAVYAGAKRKGRADAHKDDHWQAVADVYLASSLRGVMDTWHVSKGTASKWVWVARNQKGLLAKTTRGRPTGRR
ncbi:MAG TPA: hypothetical protein VME20_00700 [Acidimicrobiales bacterium]|nr:hypothetical protein [Acidimicrobiales bacterium]